MDFKYSHSMPDVVGRREGSVRTSMAVEAIGTFILVATAGVAVLSACPLASLGIGLVVMVLIYAAGHLAGGQFNAAVTLALLMRGRIGRRAATAHWLAQLGGGLLATFVVRVILAPGRNISAVGLLPADDALVDGFVATLVSAFVLSYAVLGLTTNALAQPTSAIDLATGVGAIVGAIGVAALSADAFDSATAIHELSAGLFSWSTLSVYLLGQIIAGLFAGIAFLTFGWWAHFED